MLSESNHCVSYNNVLPAISMESVWNCAHSHCIFTRVTMIHNCKILQLSITLAPETKEKALIVLAHTATVISILKDGTLKTVAKSYLTLPVTVNMLAKLINLTHTTNLWGTNHYHMHFKM